MLAIYIYYQMKKKMYVGKFFLFFTQTFAYTYVYTSYFICKCMSAHVQTDLFLLYREPKSKNITLSVSFQLKKHMLIIWCSFVVSLSSVVRFSSASIMPAPPGSSTAADVSMYVADCTGQKRRPVWEAGRFHHIRDRDCSWASRLQTEDSAHPWTESKGNHE